MRPLEWLLLLTVFLALLVLYLPSAWQQRWRFALAARVPVLVGVLHFLAEGWRTQMVPLYLLATAVVLQRARRPNPTIRRRPGVVASTVTALVLGVAGLVPAWVLPMLTLPPPTGPYPVGRVDRVLADTARERRLMVSVWYPAAQDGAPAPLLEHPHAVTMGLARAFGLPAAGPLLQHLRYATVAASTAVPALSEHAPFPVLVFSHGLVGLRAQSSSTLQDLASWGYVVVAIDHTDAAAVTVFPNGEVRPFDLQRLGISPADIDRSTDLLLPIWVADQRLVYDTLEQWGGTDPLLAGRLDVEHIGSLGHSFGGVTALEVCRVEVRCRAAVNLDGGYAPDGPRKPSIRPVLLISSSSSNLIPTAIAGWTRLMRESAAPAYWLELSNSNHYSFTIVPLMSPLFAPQDGDARAGLRVVDTFVRAFFDRYLRGRQTDLLDPVRSVPEVRWRTK